MPSDTACKDRGASKQKFYQPTHTHKVTMKPAKPQRPAGVYKVFTKMGEGKNILTRSKTL